eukprot:TRINITY_DN8578_c0_g1_i7.p1 TRINITY_DN8578_c0_g1~~TRINITY_DN8578_c0_g1_i7.p1  ORF type:complete len:135 (-),score=15.06 TRINITY_DN8578_c0_g1_i7:87-491(-)
MLEPDRLDREPLADGSFKEPQLGQPTQGDIWIVLSSILGAGAALRTSRIKSARLVPFKPRIWVSDDDRTGGKRPEHSPRDLSSECLLLYPPRMVSLGLQPHLLHESILPDGIHRLDGKVWRHRAGKSQALALEV